MRRESLWPAGMIGRWPVAWAVMVWAASALTPLAWADAPAKPKPKSKQPTTRPAKPGGAKPPRPPAAKPPADEASAAEALAVYARGDYAGAARRLAPLHKAGQANIQQRLLLGRAYMHLGKDADALAVLRSVLQTDKENPEANGLAGRLLLQAGKHELALECLEHAWRLKPEGATAAALGTCYHALGKTAKAKSFLQRALAEDIRDSANSFLLGRICLDRGQGALAEKYLLMAHEAGLDTLELHRLLGQAYLLQRKYAGPIQVRRLAQPARAGDRVDGHVVLAPDESRPGQHKLATVYCALHEGLVILKRAPMDRDGLYMTARGWHAAGRADLAGKAIKTLTAVEPKTRRVLLLQAEAALAAGDDAGLDKALAAARAARVLSDAELAELRFRQALALRAAGKRPEALKALALAARDAPTSGKILRSLATLSRALGNTADARQYYARLIELAPDADDIDELRNALKVLQESKEPRE